MISLPVSIEHYIDTHLNVMVIMRGVPGSGKSYAAEQILNYAKNKCKAAIYSTDNFFMKSGEYKWNPNAVGIAHKWNQNRVRESLEAKRENVVIVDNTNTTWKEIEPYAKMAKDSGYFVIIAETTTAWAKDADECAKRNQHSVPKEAIERMLGRWEETDSIIEKLNGLVSTET